MTLAGEPVACKYSRDTKYETDRHGVELDLQGRAGYAGEVVMRTLTWLMQTSGPGSSRSLDMHPATGDRIETLRKAP